MKKIFAVLVLIIMAMAILIIFNNKPQAQDAGKVVTNQDGMKKVSHPPADSTHPLDLTKAETRALPANTPQKPFDPLKAMSKAMAASSKEARIDQITDAFIEWLRTDPEAATRWAAENTDLRLDSATQHQLIRRGLTIWANSGDPRAAANYAATLPGDNPLLNPIDMVLTMWAKNDFNAAKTYLDQMSNPGLQAQALRGLLSTLAGSDPLQAARLSQQYGSSEDIATDSGVVAMAWATQDRNAAWKWANSLTGNSKCIASMAIAMGYSTEDPQGAAQWVLNLPASPSRSDAIQATAFALAGQDPGAAADWIMALPPGNDQTTAVVAFLNNHRNSDPALSAELAASLTDPVKRQEQLASVLTPWMQAQPDQAKKWLAANPTVHVGP